MSGKLIVFEGIEGCGKTTQLERSRHWLAQIGWADRVLLTREPGGTQLGAGVRQLLLHTEDASTSPYAEGIADRAELLLYAADRAQHVDTVLRPNLAKGALILCDRFTDSTIAYQGYGRGLDLELIAQLNQIATGGLQSDLTLWLDVEVEVGLARMQQRGKRDRIEQASIEFHRRVQTGFAALAERFSDRIVRIDASGTELAVAAQIESALSQAFTRWFAE